MTLVADPTSTRQRMAQQSGKPIIGNLMDVMNDPLAFQIRNRDLADIVTLKVIGRDIWQLSHPDDLREIILNQADKVDKSEIYKDMLSRFLGNGLLISDGDYWRRHRKLMQPSFHRVHINNYADSMVTLATQMVDKWQGSDTVDVYGDFTLLTLSVVMKALFDLEMTDNEAVIGELVGDLQHHVYKEFTSFLRLPDFIPTAGNRRKQETVERLFTIADRIINERRSESRTDRTDLLALLMEAVDEQGHHLSNEELREETLTIISAGHDTTTNTLTWGFWLLSQYPEVEARLFDEVDRVLGNRPATLDDYQQLTYTRAIVSEILRLYPAAYGVGRVTREPVTLPDGIVIPEGIIINVPIYAVHRDSRWFDDPETFKPERFLDGSDISRYAYFPFLYGPRQCIGNYLAQMETVFTIATIAQRYQLRLVPNQDIRPIPQLTLNPNEAVNMKVIKR